MIFDENHKLNVFISENSEKIYYFLAGACFLAGALVVGDTFFSFFFANFTPDGVVTGSAANEGSANANARANSSDFILISFIFYLSSFYRLQIRCYAIIQYYQ